MKPTWCAIYSLYIYQSLHVSGNYGPIIRRNKFLFMRHFVLVILCGWLSGMQEHMLLHTRQSSTQNNEYKVLHKHRCFSWWWAYIRLKHVEIDKYIKNKLCTNLFLLPRVMFISLIIKQDWNIRGNNRACVASGNWTAKLRGSLKFRRLIELP